MTTVKNKIRGGTIFLFFLLLISGGIGIYYVVQLKKDAQAILTNNYESVDYGQQMLAALDSIVISRDTALKNLKELLIKQQNNITEPGEKEFTDALTIEVKKIESGSITPADMRNAKNMIHEIMRLNMLAIQSKNKTADNTAEKALTYLTIVATVIFLIAITFSYNFPFIITNPIRKLTEAIRQIEGKNYKYRINIEQNDEFGQMAGAYNSMAARLEYFESSNLNKILFEKSRAEAVINSLKDASIGIDKKNQILFANDQALHLLGIQTEDIVGHSVEELSGRNDLFRFLIENKSQTPFKIVVSNRENYFTKEIIDIEQKDGSGSKMIILKNITSYKELDVAKTNFIATISHELKTPLASSDFGLKLLEDSRIGSITEEQKNIISHLKDDNRRMLKILSELLNMSQVEAGKIEIKSEPVEPMAIVDEAIQTVQSSAEQKQIGLKTDADEKIPRVLGDREKLVWVLNNFLTNAIKFSPLHSTVTINIKTADEQVTVSVDDQGPGIDPKYLENIFTRYFKVPGNPNPGYGLGLAISKDFIEAMQGKINASPNQSSGMSFSFTLPVYSS